jgi:4-amino-4-deoxy-L-arabinose transferase-like glycosyltransferase
MVTTLYFLSPTVLAHGHLATIDVGCMFSIFLSVFVFQWAYREVAWWRVGLAGVAWGIALLVKFTAVLLLPVFFFLVASYRWRDWRRAVGELALLSVIAMAVINLVMGFRGSFELLGAYKFVSSFGQFVTEIIPSWLPVPLPVDYVMGFDAQTRDVEAGEFGSYLFGRWSHEGWWFYGLVALAVKEPLPFLAMLAASAWWWRRNSLQREEALAIVVPLAVLLFFILFFNRLNIGVRYLLPVFPFLFLFFGAVWRELRQRRVQIVAAGILLYYAATLAWIHPAYLSYFNLAVGGPGNGHRVLADSNLDWGQDLYRLKPTLQKLGHHGPIGLLYFGHVHPGLYGIDYRLVPRKPFDGLLAVSVHYLLGAAYLATAPDGRMVPIGRDHLAWLRGREPVARAGSIWIYDTRVKRAG